MLSKGVPTSLWYPSLPDKGYSPHPGGTNTGADCRRGSEAGTLCANEFSDIQKFFGHIFFDLNRMVICSISMGTMVEEWMVCSG